MEQNTIQTVNSAIQKKLELFKSPTKYFVYSVIAGVLCSLALIISLTLGNATTSSEYLKGFTKIVMGASFSFALIMIVFAGSELFTGNVLGTTVSVLDKKTKLSTVTAMMTLCYIGNLVGAVMISVMYVRTGIINDELKSFIISSANMKMSLNFEQALFRGILCNMLICFGVWAGARTKSETAKIILLFLVILTFVGSGYEHCIANMGLFTISSMIDGFSIVGILSNLIPVSIGNIIGGSVFVGAAYWFSGSKKEEISEINTEIKKEAA